MDEDATRRGEGFAPPAGAPFGQRPAHAQPQPQPQQYPQFPPPYPAAPPSRPGGRVLVPVLVTALVAGLVGVLLGVAGTLAYQALDEPVDVTGLDGQAASDALPQRLPVVLAWVEDRVGHEFETTPEVVTLPEDEFERAVLAPSSSDAGEPVSLPTEDFTATAAALGLVADPDAYDEYVDSGFVDGVVGFYDTADEVIRLRDTSWGPSMEVTLVHELVHAIQDQVVDLDSVTSRTAAYDETYQALSAVVEGHATLVEQDWLQAQGEDYADRYYDDVPDDGGGAHEPFGAALSWLPYELGGWSVYVLEDTEGPAATFEVMAAPPTTLEQLWDVEGWRAGEAEEADPVDLPDPQPDHGLEVVDRGSLGVHVLSMLTLDDPDTYAELPYEDELPLQGWAGDEYVTWVDGNRACTKVVIATDSAAAASAMVDAVRGWTRTGAAVGADGPTLQLERCASY